ncbi:MAG: hypothetical protein K6D59_04985 [Bacteroidales bacterium]|nr:hypothetical protein [Bacteroidales bacterium]
MKNHVFVCLLLLLMSGAASAQKISNAEFAEKVVGRYLALMNINALRGDSVLYMETTMTNTALPGDTMVMIRCYQAPNRFRMELRYHDTLLHGSYTDGRGVYRMYDPETIDINWMNVTSELYYERTPGYDFRGRLYNWKADGAELSYIGDTMFNGFPAIRIMVETPFVYNTIYYFERHTGMLFLSEVTSAHSRYTNNKAYDHADSHGYLEYIPFGKSLLPNIESYRVGENVVMHYTTYKYISVDNAIFTEDNPWKK